MNKYSNRSKITGRFISKSQARRNRSTRSARSKQIVNGRLYSLNGVTVRALTQMDNGIRLVGLHKRLFGFAKDSELALITPEVVAEYLNNA